MDAILYETLIEKVDEKHDTKVDITPNTNVDVKVDAT